MWGLASCFRKTLCNPLLWILLISLPFFITDLGKPALTDSEAMYAEIAREMRLSGDWITPHINGARHFDKPPLLCWLVGLSQTFLGETEATTRVWTALASWGTIFLVGAIGARLYGKRAGWLSALVFAGCVGPYIFSRLARPDPLLLFWTALAILSYLRGLKDDGKWDGAWLCIMSVSLGLAALTKSALGFCLPATIIGLHAILSSRVKSFISWQSIGAILLAASIAVPWHAIIAINNHGFLDNYFLREHILRFTGQRFPKDENLSAPLFLLLSCIWTFPWIAFLPIAVVTAFRRIKNTKLREAQDLLPLIWFLVVICFFTVSRSRLEYYSLPAIPGIALLMGKLWDEVLPGRMGAAGRNPSPAGRTPLRSTVIVLGAMSSILALATIAAHEILGPSKDSIIQLMASAWPGSGWTGAPDELKALERIHLPTVAVLTGSAICMLLALIAVKISRPGLACGLLGAMMAPIFILVHWGFLVMEPSQSSRPIAEMLKRAPPIEVIVFQEPREYSWISGIVFYSKCMVHVLKDSRFDADKSRHREPPERFLDGEEFMDLWKSGKSVALVMDRSREDEASRIVQYGPVDEIDTLGARVVVTTGLPVRAAELELGVRND